MESCEIRMQASLTSDIDEADLVIRFSKKVSPGKASQLNVDVTSKLNEKIERSQV
jgi:hypothetical protein